MTQENYIQDNTQDLIRRAQQTLEGVPVLDLTNWESPKYMSGGSIKSLSGSCHKIEVKTTVDNIKSKCPIYVDASIIKCSGSGIGSCATDTSDPCPSGGVVSTSDYINMIAVFTMGDAQNGVQVTFKYVLNETPTATTVVINATAGINYVYAFPGGNVLYPADTSLVLYGAEVLV